MGWFQELIHARLLNDEELLKEAFVDLSSSVMGEKAAYAILRGDKKQARNAIGAILSFLGSEIVEPPEDVEDFTDQLEYMLRPTGILKRVVRLPKGWYKDCIGSLLGEKDGKVIALIPHGFSGYHFADPDTGNLVKVSRANAEHIGKEAFCFYKPLPQRAITVIDIVKYMFQSLSKAEGFFYTLSLLITTLLGLVTPVVYNLVFSAVIPSGELNLLLSTLTFLVGVGIASFLVTICQNLLLARRSTIVKINVQAAFMNRLLALPVPFFKQYSAGEMAERMNVIGVFCDLITNSLLPIGMTAVFSLVYAVQISWYAPSLLLPALGTIALSLIFSILMISEQAKLTERKLKNNASTNGLVFELFNGIQKIKLVGAETRAFSQWAKKYSKTAAIDFNPPLVIKSSSAVTGLIGLLGLAVIYWAAGSARVNVANFMSFNMAYGMLSGSILSFSMAASSLATIKPILNLIAPILETVPEIAKDKQIVTQLSGSIELNNVSFRYSEKTPMIIDNLSLKIRRGQYVAIVGKTGCGKSTLIRLLLGFETPLLGSVYYDSKDLKKLDVKSVRRKIGVVMQNGKLLQGSIFENITISAPQLTVDDAWAAAELAGLADDIRAMPMGMFTMVAEGGGGFSGGQKQRLMIARAVAAKPKILFLDEATSALDNITQRQVAGALDKFKSTRLVIAHRLSTIRQCDRIIVLDKGRIVEDGTYDELTKKGGVFADLVARQQIDPQPESSAGTTGQDSPPGTSSV
jgi:NHLM bacteriocin system ABC transporter ATP-binding protein